MTATAVALTAAAVFALATDPRCGGARPDSEFAARLVAVSTHESGRHPFAIGVNADDARGLPPQRILSATQAEAVARARMLLAEGRRIDLGLMQISDRQLARHRLSVDAAFDPCANMRAGAEHLSADFRAAWAAAHRRYNCGGFACGEVYAAGVERVLDQIAPSLVVPAAPEPPPPIPPQPSRQSFTAGRTAAGRTLTFGRN